MWGNDRGDNSGRSYGGGGRDRNGGGGFGQNRQNDGGEESMDMTVPSGKVGRIIGKGGSKIRELQDDSGARINVSRDEGSRGETTVELKGSVEACARAKEMIEELVDDSRSSYSNSSGYEDRSRSNWGNRDNRDRGGRGGFGRSRQDYDDGGEATKIKVPSGMVGRIIGRGGSKVRELQEESGAKINVSRDEDSHGETTVELRGPPNAVSAARRMIEDLTDDSQN